MILLHPANFSPIPYIYLHKQRSRNLRHSHEGLPGFLSVKILFFRRLAELAVDIIILEIDVISLAGD